MCPRLVLNSAAQVAGITCMCHHTWLLASYLILFIILKLLILVFNKVLKRVRFPDFCFSTANHSCLRVMQSSLTL